MHEFLPNESYGSMSNMITIFLRFQSDEPPVLSRKVEKTGDKGNEALSLNSDVKVMYERMKNMIMMSNNIWSLWVHMLTTEPFSVRSVFALIPSFEKTHE